MSSKLHYAAVVVGLVFLTGCSSAPKDIVRTIEKKCPPAPVEVQCERYKEFAGGSLAEHLLYDEDQAFESKCKDVALDLWLESWEDC